MPLEPQDLAPRQQKEMEDRRAARERLAHGVEQREVLRARQDPGPRLRLLVDEKPCG